MGGHRHRVEDTMMMQSVGDASIVSIRHLTMRFLASIRGYCVDCEMVVGSRLAATWYGCSFAPNYLRICSNQYGRVAPWCDLPWVRSESESTACRRYAVDGCVGDAPVMVSPALSIGDA